jgi:Tol biopolymer transport system component
MPSSGRIRLSLIVPLVCCICVCSCDDESGGFAPEPIILPQVHYYPQWSVSGDSLYFVDNGVTEVHEDGSYHVDPDSAGLRVIARSGGTARMVFNAAPFFTYALSPDGSAACLAGGGDLFIGSFVNGRLDPLALAQVTTIGGAWSPSWSPDGTWIAFDTNYNDPRGANAVWKVRPDGNDLTDISIHGTGEWRQPSWDPSGTKIVYMRYVSGDSTPASEIFVMDASGANRKRLTRNNVMDISPQFSPDGTRVCYERYGGDGDTSTHICIIRTNGGDYRELARGGMPAWSPDGSEIAYVASTDDPRTNGTIWVVKPDGSHNVQVTRSRLK